MQSPVLFSLLAVLAVSVVSLIGIALFLFSESVIRKFLLLLVSFSVGALLGDVFYHILPELAETETDFQHALTLVLVGMLLSFVLEKIIHWHHCHILPAEDAHCEHHHVGVMSLIGDGMHNFIDGTLIAASFLVGTQVGIATTLAVLLHEIPQEIGDFAILLHSGFSRTKALVLNLLSAATAFLGAFLVLASAESSPVIASMLLPVAAGNFLYLAGSDLIPELHKETRLSRAVYQLLAMIAGIAVMFALTFAEADHAVAGTMMFSGTVETMERPAPDIAYDYVLVLDVPYADPLSAYAEELTTEFPLYDAKNLNLASYLGKHITAWGSLEWGYAESRVFRLESVELY